MSSCDADPLVYLELGGPCSGLGVCVNSSTTNMLLCQCNPGYSGASDFFDNRIEQLPDGTWLSLDCGESFIGTTIVWSIFIMFAFIRYYGLLPIFFRLWKSRLPKLKKSHNPMRTFVNDFPLRTVTFDLVFATSFFFITGACKLSGMTLGTDVLPTICISLGVLSFNLINAWISEREFAMFLKSRTGAEARTKRLRFRLRVANTLIYFGFTVIPSWWTLSVDKRLGPFVNNEVTVIYFRNVGSVLVAAGEGLLLYTVRKTIAQFMESNKMTATNKSGEAEVNPLTPVVARLDKELSYLIVFLSAIAAVYVIMTIPIFFQYQTYFIALLVGVGGLRHSGKSFTATAASTSDKTADVGGDGSTLQQHAVGGRVVMMQFKSKPYMSATVSTNMRD